MLTISINSAVELKLGENGRPPKAYVSLRVRDSGKEHRYRTSVASSGCNPCWNESFSIQVTDDQPEIQFKVQNWKRWSRNEAIGVAEKVELSSLAGDGIVNSLKLKLLNCLSRGISNAALSVEELGYLEVYVSWKKADQKRNRLTKELKLGHQLRFYCDGNAKLGRHDLVVTLEWQKTGEGGKMIDLDCSAVVLNDRGRILDACYYNKTSLFNKAILHSGDNAMREGGGLKEEIFIDVDGLPLYVDSIFIVVNVHSPGTSLQEVDSAVCTLYNVDEDNIRRRVCDMGMERHGNFTGVILMLLRRSRITQRKWITRNVEYPCMGNNFQESTPAIKDLIEGLQTGRDLKERPLTFDRTFRMRKLDVAKLPRDIVNGQIGLGWDTYTKGIDLDASMIIVQDRDIVDQVYFSNLENKDFGLRHSGDNLTGEGAGDDERIYMDFQKASQAPNTIFFAVVNIFSERETFARSIRNAYIRLVVDGIELARYDLNADPNLVTRGLIFCSMRFVKGVWKLQALGKGCHGASATSHSTRESVLRIARAMSKRRKKKSMRSQHSSARSDRPITASRRHSLLTRIGGSPIVE
mmetsp:Transcript_19681/g.35109  ORF Transcript_19681/g.35109 Transcript_19681/m.35109 type:complete len:580 (-) Transcript_19681:330-2069(-)|eukprot:CAMPEP_0197519804 /NCGR_PEP_ID=MMETSP1318-20131121/5077_1 /TAXON_ID=552666 /ORGANISM="Partenskyella glossopodia, Strain RCC365" /LENGTH=579 /DNA_ID=CAMNT_0043070989 /DNA_START=553 /DNA_END=2292 /DNA_ORIENTATION=-